MFQPLNPDSASSLHPTDARKSLTGQRKLVVMAPPEVIADCILFALQREFPWLGIAHYAEVEEARRALAEPASLFLVDRSLLADVELGDSRRRYPAARIAVMVDDPSDADETISMLFASNAIRGVLPMNLKLDIWLSVVGLLLRGGEYFPAPLIRSLASDHPDVLSPTPPFPAAPATAGGGRTVHERLEELTERERQVLERVARGTQNKLIAMELRLSEHTIKIHIHNIIRKLRVHNRTEAAAFFLQTSRNRNGAEKGA